MEDLVSMCERRCRKACNLRSAAEDSDEACHSGSSGGRARRYRKRGSPKSAARDAGAMDTDPSPVRLWESEGHSEGYRTAHEPPSEPEMSAPIARAHTAPEPALQHDAEGLERPARARAAPVPRHMGPETDAIGDTPMGDESEVPGTAGCAESGGKHATCHCEHVSFLMGKYPKMGMDAIVNHLDRLDNAKDALEEDVAGILDDQSAAENHMEELRADQARYRENLELALQKQQQVVDSLLHLVEDMSGRLRRLEERQPLASGPELPAKPAAVELVERVKTLRSAMEKPMGGPAEAPYAPPRVDPGALPFVPLFSESTMLGEHTAPAGSRREGHVATDPRSLTVQMSHAAQDLPPSTTTYAVYAEEEIQNQTTQGQTMGRADGHGRGHPSGNLWAKDPNTGIWTADGRSPSRIPNPMGSGPTGPHSMEERDVRGVYSNPPATGGIRLGGVVAGDVGDAIRIDDLRGIKIPYYDGNPSNLDDFILDWEDFAEEVVGEMRGAPRDKWVCRTFPHRLAQDLKEELRDQIREGLIRTEQACLQWLEDEERVDAPNQKLEDLWSIPLPLDRGELRVREWNRYLRKYRRCLKLVEDWNEASEIRHLLKDVLPGSWKRRVEDEEKKRAKRRVAVRIMAAEDTHAGIMEFFRKKTGRTRPDVGPEERRVRGGIRGLHGAKVAAPQQRGVEARGAAEDASHLRSHEPGRDREVHHGGVEAQCEERGPRAGSAWSWTTRTPRRPPSSGDPGGHGQLRGGWKWKWPRPLVPGGSRGGPFLRVRGAQREEPWAGSVQMEPGGTQEEQRRTKEDREPTALVPRVQVSARWVLGLLWQGTQPCTRPPSVQGV